ncbi:MAG TPA: hypothetical protein VMV77_04355 [Bacteroidales bacterium]|nr:hypothetical protein [Bacteroidales bacterium]
MEIKTSIPTVVEFLDDRFYKKGDDYYPSVTTILEVYPKGPAFTQWLKDVGNQAKAIAERAAESGSKVHNAIEMIVSGREIEWDDKIYNEQEWCGIGGFIDFYENFVDKIHASEMNVFCDEFRYAGTLDFICQIQDENWLIDFKFGNAVYPTYFLQIAAYRYAVQGKIQIDRMGVLHLKAATRGRDKSGKNIQGVKWKLIPPDKPYEHLFNIFKSVLLIYGEENPEAKPKNRIYPSKYKIEKR